MLDAKNISERSYVRYIRFVWLQNHDLNTMWTPNTFENWEISHAII